MLADCWRVEVHIRSLPLATGQTIYDPENERGDPDPLILVPDPCFCQGQTSSRLATVHVEHRFESGNLQMFSWVVTNGFFLGWILQIFYLEKGIPSLLQICFSLKIFAKFWKVIFSLKFSEHFDTLFSFEVGFLSVLYSFKRVFFTNLGPTVAKSCMWWFLTRLYQKTGSKETLVLTKLAPYFKSTSKELPFWTYCSL
jgi:hypothetical protein